MNELRIFDRNDAIAKDRLDKPAFGRDIEKAPKHRREARRRWGGRLFALGGFLLLAGGLSLGAWRHYSQQRQVMATAEQQRDFAPTVPVAKARTAGSEINISLPGTTLAYTAANIFARANGYIETRKVDIGDHVKAGTIRPFVGPVLQELIDQIAIGAVQFDAVEACL